MAQITCELTEISNAKLEKIAQARGVPKSAVVRDFIEKQLTAEPAATLPQAWLEIDSEGLPVIRGSGPVITSARVKELLADFPLFTCWT